MTKAVFLSYASQDADAARRICEALRAAGLEVWFDQSELRGGDAWDASIRRKIKDCALFVPIISANTNARSEGYFRLEWKEARWWVVEAVDKKRARLNCIAHLLTQMPYREVEHTPITLSARVRHDDHARHPVSDDVIVPERY